MLFSMVSYPAVRKMRGLQVSQDLMWDVLLLRTHLGLVLPRSSRVQGFSGMLVLREEQGPPAVTLLPKAGSRGLRCFGKKRASSFSPSISELERSFERPSDTQALQKLPGTAFDPSLWGFPLAARAEPGRAQRPRRGCPLDSSVTAHLSFGVAAEHFVS